jgi:hypothetical protein
VSFPCYVCQTTSNPGEKCTRVAVQTREVVYPFRAQVQRHILPGGKLEMKDDSGGRGREIVFEVNICPRCITAGDGTK